MFLEMLSHGFQETLLFKGSSVYSAHNETAESQAGVLIWTGATSIKYSKEESVRLPSAKHETGFAEPDYVGLKSYVIGMGRALKIDLLQI